MDSKRLTKPYGAYSRRHIRRIIKNHVNSRQASCSSISENSLTSSSKNAAPVHNVNMLNNECYIPQRPQIICDSSHAVTSLEIANLNVTQTKEDLFIKHLKSWAVHSEISHNSFNRLLTFLKSDLGINVPKDCRSLLKIDKNKVHEIIPIHPGSYYHFGLKNGILNVLENSSTSFKDSKLCLSLNFDDLPLTKSSNSQFWPILGYVDSIKNSQPFPIGVYHGSGKPSDVNSYIGPTIDQFKQLKIEGIVCNNKKYDIQITKILCDAPAKAYMLNVKSHNAYFGCTKCIVEGDYINNRMAYLDINSPLRTDKDVEDMIDEHYHKGFTRLSEIGIGLVTNVPLDYIHLVCLGVVKKILGLWVGGPQPVRLFKEDIAVINANLENYRKCILKEFTRLPRSLNELDRWKATEFRNFLIYYGPSAIKNVVKEPMLSHFLSLHVAIVILLSEEYSLVHIDYAEKLLKYFVTKFSEIYGEHYINHNVHNLIHLCNDVRKFEALDNFSCFRFENYMSHIKSILKTSNYPLQQFINRHYEYETYSSDTNFVNKTDPVLMKEIGFDKLTNGDFIIEYGEYAVIQFEEKNEISVIPVNWINEQVGKSFWPKTSAKNQRTLIIKCVKPDENWPLFEIKKFFGKYDTYEEALQVEKHAAASSSETEDILQRAPGKRKVRSKLTYSPPPIIEDVAIHSASPCTDYTSEEVGEEGEIQSHASSVTSGLSGTCQNIEPVHQNSESIDFQIIPDVSNTDILEKLNEIHATLRMIMLRLNALEAGSKIKNDQLDDTKIKAFLPLNNIADLLEFEKVLCDEEAAKQLFYKYSQIGGKNEGDFIRCLTLVFTNKLAVLCSWTGQKNNFRIKDCILIKVLKDAVRMVSPTITDYLFEKLIMDWFRHSRQRNIRGHE